MCQPTPLHIYLLQETEEEVIFQKSLITNAAIAMFVILIAGCQIAIEVKIFMMNREDAKAEELAEAALRQIRKAKQKLETDGPVVKLGVEFLRAPSVVRNTWIDEEERTVNPNKSPTIQNEFLSQFARYQAIRIARYVSIFGIMPALMTHRSTLFGNCQ